MEGFLSRILPATGEYCVTAIVTGKRGAHEVFCASLSDAANAIRRLSTQPLNIFVAVGSYSKTRKVPLKKRALYLDLDGKDFDAGDWQKGKMMGLRELGRFCKATGFPIPAILVDSGNGIHGYWPLAEDLDVAPWRALAQKLKDKCAEVGLKADPTVTADAARILRVPTTMNYKQVPALPVRILQDTGGVFVATDLLAKLVPTDTFAGLATSMPAPAKGLVSINDELSAGIEYDRPDADTVRELLKHINIPTGGSERRGVWTTVISALNHWDSGGEEGFTIADEWSSTQPKYVSTSDVRKTWVSFGKPGSRKPGSRKPTTIGTLIKMAKDAGWQGAQEPEPQQPAKMPTLEDVDVSSIIGAEDNYVTRVASAVNAVREQAYAAAGAAGKPRAPKADIENILVSQFVYVKNQDTYYNLPNREIYSKEAIRDIFTPDMPRDKRGNHEDPCEILRKSPKKVIVDSLGFHPGEGPLFAEDGKDFVNRHTAPAPLIIPTRAEAALIADFVDYMFPIPEDAQFKKYWLQFNAHIVQRPGVKIATALLFISEVYGIGKSTAAYDIPRLLVGPSNARLVSNDLLEGRFTGYLGDSHFIHLQEVHVNGHWNSSKVANKLKAIVTDPTLSVEKKGQDDYNIPNRLVVTASSNFKDAMLISSKQDRRWGIYELRPNRGWTPGGIEARAYFNKIHGFLKSPRASGVLRWFFTHIQLTGFDPQNPPPMTVAKSRMVQMSLSEEQAVVAHAQAGGDAPFHRDVFHMDEIRALIKNETGKLFSSQRIGSWIGKAVPDYKRIRQIRQGNGKLWVLAHRNHAKWEAATVDQIQQELAK
jgi:Family of unknown function (DUF5906)/Primase C terminal 2 (PriCT-2)